jgi:tetratricopeptide (TPR) repeat protein
MARLAGKQESALSVRPGSPPLPAWLAAALLVAVALLVYLPALRAGFVWDDVSFLTDNPLIKAPDGLRLFWFSTSPSDYFPLTSTMLWIEWRLWHMNPAGYHVVNMLLHAVSALLLWRVLARLSAPGRKYGDISVALPAARSVPGAWLAALIFAVHPVCVESVAWITERKNTLSLPLFLASLLLYLRFDEKAQPQSSIPNHQSSIVRTLRPAFPRSRLPLYLVSVILFLLALLAKTSVVMLPVVLLLCAWWRRGRIGQRDLLRAAPFFALSLALGLATVWFQGYRAIGPEVVRTDSLLERTAGAGWAAWFYLYKAVLPVGLCCVYPRWTTSASPLSFLPALILLAVVVLFWLRRDSWGRPFLFALGYFLVMLLPVLGFLDIYSMLYSLVADRWQYPAVIGLIALAAAGASWAARRWRAPVIFCGAAAVAALGALTWDQCHAYRSDETLWLDALSKNPRAWAAWYNLGWTYRRAGRQEQAIPYFDKAIALKPDFAEAYVIRGAVLASLGRYAQAMDDYNRAIQSKPADARAYIGRAVAFDHLGRYAESLADSNRAIALRPDLSEGYVNRAAALSSLGRYAEALADCNTVIKWKPDDADAYINRAAALNPLGRYAEALDDCNRAIQLNPADPVAYVNRAAAHMGLSQYQLAVDDWDRAISLKPDSPNAYENRALAHYRLKSYDKALADVRMCLKLGGRPAPDFLKALNQATSPAK